MKGVRREKILAIMFETMTDFFQDAPSEEDMAVPFLEMGANSLTLLEIIRSVESTFGLTLTIRQFFEELTTIDVLAAYIEKNLPAEWSFSNEVPAEGQPETVQEQGSGVQEAQPTVAEHPPLLRMPQEFNNNPQMLGVNRMASEIPDSELERIMAQQLQMASQAVSQVVSQQLEFLQSSGVYAETEQVQPAVQASKPVSVEPKVVQAPPARPSPPAASQFKPSTESSGPLRAWQVTDMRGRGLTEQQRRHLDALILRYTARTRRSKELVQQHRPVLSDSRAAVGFRFSTKEMLYPIIGKRSLGSKLWDLDGNEYIDITMGFGVSLFGSHPPFITEALQEHLNKTLLLGPRSEFVGEVGALICELTGMDRVTFTNSGTEAVMAAMRLARAITGRTKMVMFEQSYHGHSDGTFAFMTIRDGQPYSIPLAPGVPSQMAENMLLLKYGDPESLQIIKDHAHELAAVLVEPVQSGRPALQPVEFLQELRTLTQEQGVLLIFDEMITGFRIHPGGAQAHFGIKADIAAYGKIVGGGMPIGVVAGKAEYLDPIDGGMWYYGDSSYPQAERTVFGGTFCQHPMTMITALAILRRLKEQGPELQERLNQRTTRFAETLNSYFEQNEVPMKVVHFGSLFRFEFSGKLDLFFYHMVEKGIYIWEWRNCFLSTAHTDGDIDQIIKAVKESIEELRAGGFLKTPTGQTAPAPAKQRIPLNEAQKQLWALAQIDKDGSLAYNTSSTIKLRGTLCLDSLRTAVQNVINRHEALRVTIDPDGMFQDIHPSLEIESPVIDFSHIEERDEQETKIQEWFTQENREAFDLEKGPLFRDRVIKLEEDVHLLVLTAHHSVVDGWSMSMMLKDICSFYSAERKGIASELEPTKQLTDFIAWQEQQSWTKEMTAHESYWLEKFSDSIPVLNLPTDRPYPPVKSYRGQRMTLLLDEHLGQEATKVAQKRGCTRFMLLLAAYTTLLHRLTTQDDIVVGVPVLGRPSQEAERLIAYCTHLMPIRSVLEENATFSDHLKTIRTTLLDAYDHQDYPFAQLLEKLKRRPDLSRSPVVSTVFNLDQLVILPEMFELEIELVEQPIGFTTFDLVFNITELGDQLILACDYSSDLFDAATIERFLGQFERLLQAVITNPEEQVALLPMLGEKEKQQLLVEWNDTAKDYPLQICPHELFEAQVERTPEALAVVFPGNQSPLPASQSSIFPSTGSGHRNLQSSLRPFDKLRTPQAQDTAIHVTYRELNARINQLAHYLQSRGVGAEVTVGVCMERSLEMVIAVYAILKAGGAYVQIDPDYPKERIAFMIEDAQMSVILTQQKLLTALPSHEAETICPDDDWGRIAQQSTENPQNSVRPDNLAYVLYTSGSTGAPKGCQLDVANLNHYLQWAMDYYFENGEGGNFGLYSSLSFDLTVTSLFLPLLRGKTLCLFPQSAELVDILKESFRQDSLIDCIKLTPSHISVLKHLDLSATNIRLALVGGEALSLDQVHTLQQLNPEMKIYNEYGPTEATVGCIVKHVRPDDERVLIGKPIHNMQIYILDPYLQPVPVGVPGEIHIGGDGLARGYLKRDDLTHERFIPNPFDEEGDQLYKTGDVGRWLPDGNIEYLGRNDDQVKIRGYRVELGEIEARLLEHNEIQDALVVAKDFAGNGQKELVAYVVLSNQSSVNSKQSSVSSQQSLLNTEHRSLNTTLRQHLQKTLPGYMLPAYFVRLAEMPLTLNGKLDRERLPAPEGTRPELQTAFVLPQTKAEQGIATVWQDVLQLEKVGIHDNFFDVGGHSLRMVEVCSKLKEHFGPELSIVELFQYPTIHTLASFLSQEHPEESLSQGYKRAENRRIEKTSPAIAIVGMSCRFPGANTVAEFWKNLCEGVESMTVFSDEELLAAGVDPELVGHPHYVKANRIVSDPESFDASFFGVTPNEAQLTDPQHRLFLESAWEVLESAGYDPDTYTGTIGVYAGAGLNTYLLRNLFPNIERFGSADVYQLVIGNDKDYLPSRISYKLNLKGPAVNVQTACSTSLAAVHIACQSLLNGECDMALAGGVTVNTPQKAGYLYEEGMILSPDGHCRAFDARAQGTVDGSGLGIVLLKRVKDAVAEGDQIFALIKGSAINNDGSAKVGYTAPSVEGQSEVIAEAQMAANVDPEMITYIETHGTGTVLGDPVEIAALTKAFRYGTQKTQFCAIGSVKTNVGHLDTAAGVAGLIKTVLALKNNMVPPSLHFEQPNPKIDFANSPFYVNTTLSEWKSNGIPRHAGVSSFGIGGTNVHVVLQEAPPRQPSGPSRPWQLLVLSAKTDAALERATENLVEYLTQHPDLPLADVAYTLQVGRKAFDQHRILVCNDCEDAAVALRNLDPKRVLTKIHEPGEWPLTFMFSGQGAQYIDMGRELYELEPTFAQQVDACVELLKPHLSFDLREVLFPDPERVEEATERLKQTALTQPALFVIEYALARLWMEWGVRPQQMIGHSVGEYVAACLAGVFSLEDGLRLIAARGEMMQQLPGGAMLAVLLPEQEVQTVIDDYELSLSTVNGEAHCVISGCMEEIDRLQRQLTEQGVDCQRLHTSHAFHSEMMESLLGPFTELFKDIRLHPPQIPFVSNVSGAWITAAEATDPAYWAKHLRQTVRFYDGLGLLLKESRQILLEVGPGRTLRSFVMQHPDKAAAHIVLTSLRHPKDQQSDLAFLLSSLGKLWLAGAKVDWNGFSLHEARQRVSLPTYPFERKRYWVEARDRKSPNTFLQGADSVIEHQEQGTNSRGELSAKPGSLQPRPDVPNPYVGPRNQLEQTIVGVWQHYLGIEPVGIHDDLFELGGHSLLATRIVSQLREILQLNLPISSLLNEPTVAGVAQAIERFRRSTQTLNTAPETEAAEGEVEIDI